jgi:hypothetical protein
MSDLTSELLFIVSDKVQLNGYQISESTGDKCSYPRRVSSRSSWVSVPIDICKVSFSSICGIDAGLPLIEPFFSGQNLIREQISEKLIIYQVCMGGPSKKGSTGWVHRGWQMNRFSSSFREPHTSHKFRERRRSTGRCGRSVTKKVRHNSKKWELCS